ncbi:MAG: electron transport complex subunit E [Oscillospiraceae bacterium]|nr:electron transport complex subunit E [Oscillospiraceae bacterium]
MKSSGKGLSTLTVGIIKENPVLVMLLGICPTLAVTTTLSNGIGMGITTMFVLVCSNITISLLKGVIPENVRLPCYIVVIAGFVTFIEKILETFVPELYDSLGLFLPLIVVNCIVMARAEGFASKNNPLLSALDGLGKGIGFTLALSLMGLFREILGGGTILAGTDYAVEIPILSANPMLLFIFPAGGFFTFAMLIAVVNTLAKRKNRDYKPRQIGCGGDCKNCASKKSSCATQKSEEKSA